MKERLKTTFLILFVMAFCFNSFAQNRTITGKVVDEKGELLVGVNIIIESTKTGTITDVFGQYTLSLPVGDQIVKYSFIGMEDKVVTIDASMSSLDVCLLTSLDELSEVVVTGYKNTTKREATGSVATLTSETFENQAVTSVDNILQGKVAGVNSVQSSGRPGEAAKIRIRGTATLSGNAEPLWVIDGVPMQKDNNMPNFYDKGGPLKDGDINNMFSGGVGGINPNDIENITILKDASATAIYGSRASGGVIVVTTKRGKQGKMSVNYSSNVSMQLKPQRQNNMMNGAEKIAFEKELWDEFSAEKYQNGEDYPVIGIYGMIMSGKGKFAGLSSDEKIEMIESYRNTDTDFFDELLDNSFGHNHYLSFAGGKEHVNYYISLGYSSNDGIVKRTGYNRYNLNTKLDFTPTEKLKVGLVIDMSNQKSKGFSGRINPYKYAYFANPYEKLYNADGSYASDETYLTMLRNNVIVPVPMVPNGYNIMREIDHTDQTTLNNSATITSNLNYILSKELRFKGIASYSFTQNDDESIIGEDTNLAFSDRLPFDSNNQRTYGNITQSSGNNQSYTLRGQFNYDKYLFDTHRLSLLIGSEIRSQKTKSIYSKRYGYDSVTKNHSTPTPLPGTVVDLNDMISFANFMDYLTGSYETEETFASFYGSADYFINNKYVTNFTVRTDGSNHFGSEEQFNPTWSIGGAWHIDQEDFAQSLKPFISRLSLRAATGFTGNVNRTVAPQLIMTYDKRLRDYGNTRYRVGKIVDAPNPNLRWEKTKDYKFALNIGLLDDRISLSPEYYYRKSIDVVTIVTVPSSTGYHGQGYNTSTIENKGFECTLSAKVIAKDSFSWNATVNMAINKNTLLDYRDTSGYINNGSFAGYPLDACFTGKNPTINPSTGVYMFEQRSDAIFVDAGDYKDAENYNFYVGAFNADVTGGFSTNISYKRLNLTVSGNYSLNEKVVNNLEAPRGIGSFETSTNASDVQTQYNDLYTAHYNVKKDRINRWTPGNPITNGYPRIIDALHGDPLNIQAYTVNNGGISNSVFLEDMSFLRIKNITLSYALPEKIVNAWGIKGASCYSSLSNFFTLTDFSGIDPESHGAVYPITRSVVFGVNVNF